MQKITPCLWFDNNAEEAIDFYTSIFKKSKIISIARYGKEQPRLAGKVMTATIALEGMEFMVINGGPEFKFTPAISLVVHCGSQQEVDELWLNLSRGGEEGQCGWLTDKFGVSWQIVPDILGELMGRATAEQADNVMKALLQMGKLDIAGLKKAFEES